MQVQSYCVLVVLCMFCGVQGWVPQLSRYRPCRFSMQVKSQVLVASAKLEQQARPFRRGGRWRKPKETSTGISYIPLKEAVQGQNLTTIIATFKSIRSSDSAWYVNKLIPTLSGGTLEAFWREYVLNVEDLARKVDRYTHTSAMSLLNRNQRYEAALDTFEAMRFRGWSIDVVTYVAAVRAAGYIRPFAYVTDLLNDAHRDLGNKSLPVARAAIINLKFIPTSRSVASKNLMDRAWTILRWMESKQMNAPAEVMDSALAVACAHGTDADCEEILSYMQKRGIPASPFTFNTLLNRHAERKNRELAHRVVGQMVSAGFTPDETTYNTLLKLSVNLNDAAGAIKVVTAMRNAIPAPLGEVTKSLLLRLRRTIRPDSPAAAQLVDLLETEVGVGPKDSRFVWASRIENCNDTTTAVSLFEAAKTQSAADAAVYVAVAKCLARCGDVEGGLAHIDAMLQKGIDFDKFALSSALRLATDAGDLSRCLQYLRWCIKRHPQLLTQAVWNKIDTFLPSVQTPRAASSVVDVLTEALERVPNTARFVHKAMVSRLVRGLDIELALANASHSTNSHRTNTSAANSMGTTVKTAAEVAASAGRLLLSLGHALQREGTGGRTLGTIVHTFSFNDVLRMLEEGGRADLVPDVFAVLQAEYTVRSSGNAHHRSSENITNHNRSDRTQLVEDMTVSEVAVDSVVQGINSTSVRVWHSREQPITAHFRPTNFTIATLVRSGRLHKRSVGFVADVLRWAMRGRGRIPFYAISDALSYIFSTGERDKVVELYGELHRQGHVQHWEQGHSPEDVSRAGGGGDFNSGDLVMNLHEFSRGMAYAAIKVGIEQGKAAGARELVVIVGKGELRGGKPDKGAAKANEVRVEEGNNQQRPFRLVEEIQDMLIEDFYPPIPSSTVPDNPGRIIIPLV